MRLYLGLTALLIAPAVSAAQVCEWASPGHNVYKKHPTEALKNFKLTALQRQELHARMWAVHYDDVATIRRNSIQSESYEYTDLRQMHFGTGQVCGRVSTAKWTDRMVERALIYCTAGPNEVCVAVPTVCNNVSLVTRTKKESKFDPPGFGGLGGVDVVPLPLPGPLEPLEAPGAGGAPLSSPTGVVAPSPVLPVLAPPTPSVGPAAPYTPYPFYTPPPAPGPWFNPVPVPGIPEPATYLTLLAGVLAIFLRKKYL